MKIIFRKYDLESGGDILPLLPIAVATGEENCCIPEAVEVWLLLILLSIIN
jgi:hypothetical protein